MSVFQKKPNSSFYKNTGDKMELRWILLVVALVQRTQSFSPIPVEDLDQEWETFSTMLRDPAYRLPTTTVPRHYELFIEPYFEETPPGVTPFTFNGGVTIFLSPTEPGVTEIIMHCHDLNITSLEVSTIENGEPQEIPINSVPVCEMPYAFMRIQTTTALIENQEYIVNALFTGNLQTDMRGFYRSWYEDSIEKRWMGTTQFQPGHARKAFPCYDEPGFKATFDITIIREANFTSSISNMPINPELTVNLTNGKVSETFYTTPKTSTYLLAFIVSHYEIVASTTNPERPFDIYARDNAGSTGDWSLTIGELLLDEMERYTNISYYDMAENMNMKQAAIPDFSAGAMENWGLLTYREALILYDPVNSNHFYRQRVANIVAHEIAHMWFGNLVTCAWWDNLWLNEGFARYYQYYLTHSVAPELGYSIRFIVEQVHTAMFSDSVDSAHALTNLNVNDPDQVSNHFSTITYARGAAVLRMTQHLLGNSTYLAALRSYLDDRKYDVAEPEHLFDAFEAAAAADGAMDAYNGITVTEYFKTWSEHAGHPLLTVNVNQLTGEMIVTQVRFERNTGLSEFQTIRYIPVTWTRAGDPEFEDLKPSQILTEQATVINRGTTGLEWVIFNKQESGFYRVNYDDNNWALITRALRSDERTSIHELNRAQIVDDVFQLARAGVMGYTRAMNILSFLEFEDAYAPWLAAISGFAFVIRRVAHNEEDLGRIQQEIIQLSSAVTGRLGYADISSDTYMDGLLRMYVLEFLCNIGHEECIDNAVTNFADLRNGGFVPANMRPWVYCSGLREGTAEDFNFLWQRYVDEDLASEKIVMLQTLGCTRDRDSIFSFLTEIVADNDNVRPQDYATAFSNAVYGNEENALIALDWLSENIEQTITAFGSVANPLSYIASRLLSEEQITYFEDWLNSNQEAIGTAYTTGMNAAASARENLVWSETRVPEIRNYLDVGYVDDVISIEEDTEAPTTPTTTTTTTTSTTTTTTTTTTTPAPVTTEAPDSANIAALSLVTLIMTITVNLML